MKLKRFFELFESVNVNQISTQKALDIISGDFDKESLLKHLETYTPKKRGCIYSKEGFVVVASQDKSLLQNIKSQFFKSNKSQELTAGKMQVMVFEV
jgi:hypothetical protein